MRDVSDKTETLRVARTTATLRSEDSFPALLELAHKDKGDALQIARIAGILAAKNTPDAIPLCHTIPILHSDCSFDVQENEIVLSMTATTRAQTGVEIEALHAVSTAAVTLYDVLKPHTDSLEIDRIRLVEKTGGKSDHRRSPETSTYCRLLLVEDHGAGQVLEGALQQHRANVEVLRLTADDLPEILRREEQPGVDLVIGELQQVAPWQQSIREAVDTPMPGIAQAVRQYGLQRHPWAMFTALVSGWVGKRLVITAPADPEEAQAFSTVLIPYILCVDG